MRDALADRPVPARLVGGTVILLCLVMAPHAANLHPAVVAFFYAGAAWRLVALRHPRLLPGRWLLLLLMLAALALVVSSTGLREGRVAGTALLVTMLGLKLLESRTRRDLHVTLFLGYFLVLTHFLYDQSLWLAILSFVGVSLLVAAQVGLNRVHMDARLQLRTALLLIVAAAPLALTLFLLFPRLQTPLWGINTDSALTGISDEMALGSIGELSQSTATAFRVRFLGEPPPPQARYWRGPVLWQTEGGRWTRGLRGLRTVDPEATSAAALDYEITLEPTGEYWLFGLDIVTAEPPDSHVNSNYTLISEQRVHRRMTYRASSDVGYTITALSDHQRAFALQLPDQVSSRVRQLAAGWQQDAAGPQEIVARALRHFREQPFVYTLTPGVTTGDDPVDHFLFESRRGFCEHYAGSFALLMRVAGVPSRVVIGYQGGTPNPHAEHWVVRQSDAHAWTEVWFEGRGWVRVDPTAAVAPERIERPIDAGLSQDADRVVFDTGDFGLLRSLWLQATWVADAVDLGWYRWVVNFTAERQESLLEALGINNDHGYGLAMALVVGGGLAMLLVYLVAKMPRPRRRDPLPLLWDDFRAKLRRRGVAIEPWHGPDTVCAGAAAAFPAARGEIQAINRLYVQLRYGPRHDSRQVGSLRRRIRRLRLRPS
jgi:transglutaminase-like putative cysteine protease